MENKTLKILLFISLTIIVSQSCYSQEEPSAQNRKGEVLVKLSPVSLIDPRMPNIELGASVFLEEKLAIQLKIGVEHGFFSPDDKYKSEGIKLALEYQYFTSPWLYLSIENGYLTNRYAGDMDYLMSDMDSTLITDSYFAEEERLFGTFKVGSMFFLRKRWRIELYGGIGVQYYRRKIHELEFDEELGHVDPEIYIHAYWGIYHEEIDELRAKLSLGVNIGFRL